MTTVNVNPVNPQRAGAFDSSKRRFVWWVTGVALFSSAGLMGLFNLIFLKPRVTYGPPTRFRVGRPETYSSGAEVVFSDSRVVVRHRGNGFAAIGTVCTHLGCTVAPSASGFDCPCHGSRYDDEGNVVGGPAPRGLPWYRVSLAPNGELEVDRRVEVAAGTYLEVNT